MKAWHWSVALPVVVLTGCNSSSGDNPPPPTDSLTSVSITSKPTVMFIGDSMTLSAQAIWSSGKTEDITQQASWSVTEDVALIENYTLTALQESDSAALTLSYQNLTDNATFVIRAKDEEIELTELEVSAFEPSMMVGETQTPSVTAKYSDGSDRDVSALTQWQSQDASVVQVEAGMFTAIGEGRAELAYEYQTLSGTLYVDVMDVLPELTEIEIQSHDSEVIDGYSLTLTAFAHYSDESSEEISADVEWQSDNANIASFVGNELKTHAEGDVVISISYEGEKDTSAITVTPAVPMEIVPNVTTGNHLEVLQGESISRQVSITLSNGRKEYYDDAQVFFTGVEMDEQSYFMFSVSDDAVRTLRSGSAEFYIHSLPEALRHRFDQMGIEYDRSSAHFTVEVAHNPNLYQWHKQLFSMPSNNYRLQESFTQDNKIYYVWNVQNGNVLEGVALTVFDGTEMSEPVMLIEGMQSAQSTLMVNGGGNGHYLHHFKYASGSERMTVMYDLSDLSNRHVVDLSTFHRQNWPSFNNNSAIAFDSQGRLIYAEYASESPYKLTRFHRYDPTTSVWEHGVLEIIGERVGQQLKHPDHMLVINAQSAGVAPSFHFVDIDTLTVTHETALQYPQNGVSEFCTSKPNIGLALTDDIEKFAVHCFGSKGNESALERLLWTTPEQAPLAYTKEPGANLYTSTSDHPIVTHIHDQVFGAYGYVKNGDGSENIHIDRATDHLSELSTDVFDMTQTGSNVRYTYTGKPIAGTNHVVDSSHFALTNPHVPDETVMLHYDAVSVWSESQQRWFTDEEIFGTRYLSSFGNLGAGYIFQLNGHWHFSRDTSGSSGRGILITTLHMRNPDSSQ